jgi:hypothetical protein
MFSRIMASSSAWTAPFSTNRVEGRRTWFETPDEMQTVLAHYPVEHNTKRPHGRTPITAFIDGIAKEDTLERNPNRRAP